MLRILNGGRCRPLLLALFASMTPVSAGEFRLEGTTVVPHVRAESMRFRVAPADDLGARVQVFLRAEGPGPSDLKALRFDGKAPGEWLDAGLWTWHSWPETVEGVPPGSLVVGSFNGLGPAWGPENGRTVGVDWGGPRAEFPLVQGKRRITALTFLGDEADVRPNRLIVHIANDGDRPVTIAEISIYLPIDRRRPFVLARHATYQSKVMSMFAGPGSDSIARGDRGGAVVTTGPLPLSYGVVEVQVSDGVDRFSLWALQRVRKEVFDISGGWVAGETPRGPSQCQEIFLKTLKRFHVNVGQHESLSGYDETFFAKYPLKMFNRLMPLERYDTDEALPRIHAVEFLGEPQMRGRGHRSPQQVFDEFRPYSSSRLHTSVTLSDASTWHRYAGLSDYPHYDAYRVTAPMADAWSKYDRWDGETIRWGAPLETIGDMTRSLRENSRPAAIAAWTQGPHEGWSGMAGRKRGSPTVEELRAQAYQALSARVTSLYWFNLSLKSIVKYRDTFDELTRVGRTCRMIDHLLLEGDGTSHQETRREGRPDWDLSVVAGPSGALLFALDLDYKPDPNEHVFRFGPPRPASFKFPLPGHARTPRDVFRLDAEGVYDVRWKAVPRGVAIEDTLAQAGVYVAAKDGGEREKVDAKRRELLAAERALAFDPARDDDDFKALQAILESPKP